MCARTCFYLRAARLVWRAALQVSQDAGQGVDLGVQAGATFLQGLLRSFHLDRTHTHAHTHTERKGESERECQPTEIFGSFKLASVLALRNPQTLSWASPWPRTISLEKPHINSGSFSQRRGAARRLRDKLFTRHCTLHLPIFSRTRIFRFRYSCIIHGRHTSGSVSNNKVILHLKKKSCEHVAVVHVG